MFVSIMKTETLNFFFFHIFLNQMNQLHALNVKKTLLICVYLIIISVFEKNFAWPKNIQSHIDFVYNFS